MYLGNVAAGGFAAFGRRLRALVMIMALSSAIVLTGAGPARAEAWPIGDSFENSPHTRWSDFAIGPSGAHFTSGDHLVRTGTLAVMLQARLGWASMERWITLDPSAGVRVCGASVFAFALGSGGTSGTATVNLEVIDAATWTYVSFATVEVVKSTTFDAWTLFNFSNFLHTSNTIVIRVGVDNPSQQLEQVLLDDFSLWCSRPIS
jgi:hypothetical protein